MLLQDGEFKFYAVPVPYKTMLVSKGGYIRNKVTGENCGHKITLYKNFYDEDRNLLEVPQTDEDIYEVVYDQSDNI